MLNLRRAVLRLCLRALLTGAGAGYPSSQGRREELWERQESSGRDNCSLLGSMSGGEYQPTQTLHLDIQDPTGFRAYFLVKVGAKVRHFPFCLLGPRAAVHVLSS